MRQTWKVLEQEILCDAKCKSNWKLSSRFFGTEEERQDGRRMSSTTTTTTSHFQRHKDFSSIYCCPLFLLLPWFLPHFYMPRTILQQQKHHRNIIIYDSQCIHVSYCMKDDTCGGGSKMDNSISVSRPSECDCNKHVKCGDGGRRREKFVGSDWWATTTTVVKCICGAGLGTGWESKKLFHQ